MKENKLPEIFDTFEGARKDGFLTIKNIKDTGKNVVGIFCTYTPVEIIMAANALYVSLCSTSDETIPEAEKNLPRNLCPLIKSSYGFAVTDKCPYMYFADLIVGETTCDGKKKMYELLGNIKNVHVMQLPNNQSETVSKDMWYKEVLNFKNRIEKDFKVIISDEEIKKAIREKIEKEKYCRNFMS